MPSAAAVKEKQTASTESALAETGNAAVVPLRQAITIIEHKIRNLEKRKSKLESYRDLQNAGKELNTDQKTALAKIDEVIMTLDFARDLYKQFLGIASTSEKEAKKQAKREASLKNQAEMARVREILLVQDVLNQMGIEGVRDDFLNGRNGASQLTEPDLKLLDDLYPAVTPKHEAGNPTVFTNEVQAAAEHLLAVVDGKPKEVFGGTYSQVKEILGKIHESGYFDRAQELAEENVEIPVETVVNAPVEVVEGPNDVGQMATGPIDPVSHPIVHVSVPNRIPPVLAPEQLAASQVVPAIQVPPPRVIEPVTNVVSHQPTPQELFYQPKAPQPQAPPRPISEMLGPGNFFFLQESEIDTPDQIPTQTFTNQQFVVQPPPPIPLPPNFQPPPQQLSPVNLPPTVNSHHQAPPVVIAATPVAQQQAPVSQLPPQNSDISLNKAPIKEQAPVDNLDKQQQPQQQQQHSLGGRVPNRGPSGHHQQHHHHSNPQQPPQSFYNNGYNGRPNNRPGSSAQHHSRNNGVHQSRAQTARH